MRSPSYTLCVTLLYITVGVFPEFKQQGGPHQEHMSKKKQQEIAHKFLLHMRVAETHAWLFNSSYRTHPCNYDCVPTCDWLIDTYNTPVVIKSTHAWTFNYSCVIVLVTTLRTTSGHGPKPSMDLDFTHAIKTRGTTKNIAPMCAVVTGWYHMWSESPRISGNKKKHTFIPSWERGNKALKGNGKSCNMYISSKGCRYEELVQLSKLLPSIVILLLATGVLFLNYAILMITSLPQMC